MKIYNSQVRLETLNPFCKTTGILFTPLSHNEVENVTIRKQQRTMKGQNHQLCNTIL